MRDVTHNKLLELVCFTLKQPGRRGGPSLPRACVGSHKKWNMADVFKDFDYDNDGKLTMKEFYRAFRALGLEKRTGEKMEIDKAMFDSFDTNGDGFVSLVEFQEGLLPKTRKKIVDKLEAGWKFDKEKWDASVERHKDDA